MRTSALWYGTVATMVALAKAGEIRTMNTSLEMEIDSEFAAIYPRAELTDFQLFRSGLAGKTAESIFPSSDPGNPFSVRGETTSNLESAVKKSCSFQKQACADFANSPQGGGGGGGKDTPPDAVTVNACDKQNEACIAANKALGDMKFQNEENGNLIFCDS